MRTDVVDLRDFYRSPLGRVAERQIARRVRAIWPDVRGLTVAGYGYAGPALVPFRGEAERVLSLMPASQGVLHWPGDEANLAALTEEEDLPLPDLSVDRLVLLHGLETADALRPLMRELWRVLAGNGRLLAIVPNRRGLWARTDATPFGNGQPYSVSQLGRRLRDSLFTPLQQARALYVPPLRRQILLKGADAWEEVGMRWFPQFGGVVLVEASKQLYAGVSEAPGFRLPRLRPALRPAAPNEPRTDAAR
jgi:SAM-dependent methyltransferase